MIDEIVFNIKGSYTAAFYFSVLPLIMVVIFYFLKRTGRASETAKPRGPYGYLPVAITLVIYFGLIYWWLFYDQFYRASIMNDGRLNLEYQMPKRNKSIQYKNIADIQTVTGDIKTYKMTRILILTKDGKQFLSAQIPAGQVEAYLKTVNKYKNFLAERQI